SPLPDPPEQLASTIAAAAASAVTAPTRRRVECLFNACTSLYLWMDMDAITYMPQPAHSQPDAERPVRKCSRTRWTRTSRAPRSTGFTGIAEGTTFGRHRAWPSI